MKNEWVIGVQTLVSATQVETGRLLMLSCVRLGYTSYRHVFGF